MTEPGLTPPDAAPAPTPGGPARRTHPLVRDAVVVLGWFLAAAVVGALVWWQVSPLAEYTKTATGGRMAEDELGRQVSADGWYFVIAAALGLVSGVALTVQRRRDPLATVVLVAVGALVAAWVMLRVGLVLGPGDPEKALVHASAGDTVPMQLRTHATGLPFVWPIAALLGAVGVLWGVDEHRHEGASDR